MLLLFVVDIKTESYKLPFSILHFAIWLLNVRVWLNIFYHVRKNGASDFFKMDSASKDAPYQVGVTYIKMTAKKLDTSIFYPMDKQENPNYDAFWFRDPAEAFKTFKRECVSVLGLPMIPDVILRPIVNNKIPATIDG